MTKHPVIAALAAAFVLIGTIGAGAAEPSAQDHDAHHPGQTQGSGAGDAPAAAPEGMLGEMPGMTGMTSPEMMKMMTPEMMEMMQNMHGMMQEMHAMMRQRAGAEGAAGMAMPDAAAMGPCPMMAAMAGNQGDAPAAGQDESDGDDHVE